MTLAMFALVSLLLVFPFLAGTDAVVVGDQNSECVDFFQPEACENRPDGKYHLCNACHLGYYVRCENKELTIRTCPHFTDSDGTVQWPVWDTLSSSCLVNSPTCRQSQLKDLAQRLYRNAVNRDRTLYLFQ